MLSADQILALAPDDSAAKAAKGLLNPAKWPTLGTSDALLWGECQGSGSNPYQVIIDLAGPTFKCTCPSRKFPCKHGLALHLLRVQKEGAFKTGDPAPWAKEWLDGRQSRAEKAAVKKGKAAEPSEPEDPAAAQKRERERMKRVREGAADLDRWLSDLLRQGISELPSRPAPFWHAMAARLVDAQASGLAHWVRAMQSAAASGEGWPQRVLSRMGRLQLLLDAIERVDDLPDSLGHDVRTAIGFPLDKDEVLRSGDTVSDVWRVRGISYDEMERLWERRVWLEGAASGRHAVLLEFSHGQRRYDRIYTSGSSFQGTLAFFPAAFPSRALLVDAGATIEADRSTPDGEWEHSLLRTAASLAQNPWLTRWSFAGRATPAIHNGTWFAQDSAGRRVRLSVGDDEGWKLRSISGGQALPLFGEWSGEALRPLTLWSKEGGDVLWTESTTAA